MGPGARGPGFAEYCGFDYFNFCSVRVEERVLLPEERGLLPEQRRVTPRLLEVYHNPRLKLLDQTLNTLKIKMG